ncbi:MAG: hypothetical protein DIZ80_03210 [endosymbiont of Galathealinum brachiosum]|uniref:Uncharacterized protein n=1 Tax=endosymbiont of Galathealinum brachiosum TaxID=2200906 RepID=A0A370DHW5_9GAMM|nr:MAG: hypothetical protein DIZ80_03210 [endosymbiont of Galathealinum brachiosum]
MKMTFYKRFLSLLYTISIILVTGLMSNTSMAMTPDGETPANEGVCDPLMDATKGLYGLCVAYCEAQDLDSFDKEPPRTKILDNYNKKKLSTDPDMPCVSPNYGCFTQAQLDAIDPLSSACSPAAVFRNGEWVQYGSLSHLVRVDTRGTPSCGYKTLTPFTVVNLTITAEQAAAAYNAVDAKCNEYGY